MFQHRNRRHRRLPWAGQPAYLPGDLPRLLHSLPYHVSKVASKSVHITRVCLLQVRVEKDKVIIRANKQVRREKKVPPRMWRIYVGK